MVVHSADEEEVILIDVQKTVSPVIQTMEENTDQEMVVEDSTMETINKLVVIDCDALIGI